MMRVKCQKAAKAGFPEELLYSYRVRLVHTPMPPPIRRKPAISEKSERKGIVLERWRLIIDTFNNSELKLYGYAKGCDQRLFNIERYEFGGVVTTRRHMALLGVPDMTTEYIQELAKSSKEARMIFIDLNLVT